MQAESMMALWKLWKHSGQVGYLQKLAQSTRFMREHVLDNVYGEMFWQVGAAGSAAWKESGSCCFRSRSAVHCSGQLEY